MPVRRRPFVAAAALAIEEERLAMKAKITIMAALTVLTIGGAAGAAPIMPATAAPVSGVQLAQYHAVAGDHRFKKCYREFVFGRYVCHSYHYW